MLKRTLLIAAFVLPSALWADPPEILEVKAKRQGMGWKFEVTLQHPDTGWDHYADGWEVLDVNGRRLAIRELMHPHVQEQPFTRSLTNVPVPDGARQVLIRARCNIDGWNKTAFVVDLQR